MKRFISWMLVWSMLFALIPANLGVSAEELFFEEEDFLTESAEDESFFTEELFDSDNQFSAEDSLFVDEEDFPEEEPEERSILSLPTELSGVAYEPWQVAPTNLVYTVKKNTVTLSWTPALKKLPKNVKYYVYEQDEETGGALQVGKATAKKKITLKKVPAGEHVYFVRAEYVDAKMKDEGYGLTSAAVRVTVENPLWQNKPVISLTAAEEGVCVSWKVSEPAEMYELTITRGKGKAALKEIRYVFGQTEYLDESAVPGVKTSYAVMPIQGGVSGKRSAAKSFTIPTETWKAAPVITGAWQSGDKQVTLTWRSSADAEQYIIAGGTKAVTVQTATLSRTADGDFVSTIPAKKNGTAKLTVQPAQQNGKKLAKGTKSAKWAVKVGPVETRGAMNVRAKANADGSVTVTWECCNPQAAEFAVSLFNSSGFERVETLEITDEDTALSLTITGLEKDIYSYHVRTITYDGAGVHDDEPVIPTVDLFNIVIDAESIELNKTSLSLGIGGTETISAVVKPDNTTNNKVFFSSNHPEIAAVDADGKVYGVRPGSATLTAKTHNGKTAVCAVTVTNETVNNLVTGISLSRDAITLSVGDEVALAPVFTPANATNQSVTWKSNRTSVATVKDGIVTAVAKGNATITVTSADGGKTATCAVTVTDSVTGISLDKSSESILVGKTLQLNATMMPASVTGGVTWTSSNEKAATVSDSGLVTGVATGTAVITATAPNGGYKATCQVNVATSLPVTDIKLSKTSLSMTVGGGTQKLTATVTPTGASSVTWSSSNTGVAKVSNGTVTPVKAGTATITAKSGDKTAYCSVEVAAPVAVTGIAREKRYYTAQVGETIQLGAHVLPENATNQQIIWSTNSDKVSVTSDGKLTGVGNTDGTVAVIAQSAENADIRDKVSVYIGKPLTGLTISAPDIVNLGSSATTVTVTGLPSDAKIGGVDWSIDDESIAICTNGGKEAKFQFLKPGFVTLTAASTYYPEITASKTIQCRVKYPGADGALTVTSSNTGDVTVTWPSVAGAAGYRIYYSNRRATDSSYDAMLRYVQWVDIDNGNTTSYTFKSGLAEEKTNYFMVDAYDEYGYDSDWLDFSTSGSELRISVDEEDFASAYVYPRTDSPVELTDFTISQSSMNLNVVGDTGTLTVTKTPANATTSGVGWRSSDKSVVTVKSRTSVAEYNQGKSVALITAKGPGVATITATCEGITVTCTVTVANGVAVPVTGVTMNKPKVTLTEVGGTAALSATISPSTATNKKLWWYSEIPECVTVDQTGTVTAVAGGAAKIWCRTNDGGYEDYCIVTVDLNNTSAITTETGGDDVVAVTGVSLSQNSLDLKVGNTKTLTATVSPSNATNKSVAWTSSKPSVATVSNGVVTAVGAGTATITAASVYDTNKKATCTVNVTKDAVLVTGVSLGGATVEVGSKVSVARTITPSSADNQALAWTSSNTGVATVDQNGVVTGVAAGSATVTAAAQDGSGKSGSCTVTVKERVVQVTSVSLIMTNYTMEKGDSVNFVATVLPGDATDRTVVWSSSNSKVATVSYGTITAVNYGTAVITAAASDGGGAKAELTITVPNPQEQTVAVKSVAFSTKRLGLEVGGSASTLTATVSPGNATVQAVNWSTSNAGVAAVANGVVTPVGAGTATITVRSVENSSIYDTCVVTVTDNTAADPAAFNATVTPKTGGKSGQEFTIKLNTAASVTSVAIAYLSGSVVNVKPGAVFTPDNSTVTRSGGNAVWTFKYPLNATGGEEKRTLWLRCFDANGNSYDVESSQFECVATPTIELYGVNETELIEDARYLADGFDIAWYVVKMTNETKLNIELKNSKGDLTPFAFAENASKTYPGTVSIETTQKQVNANILIPQGTAIGKYTIRFIAVSASGTQAVKTDTFTIEGKSESIQTGNIDTPIYNVTSRNNGFGSAYNSGAAGKKGGKNDTLTRRWHTGIDYAAPEGQGIGAFADGVVRSVGFNSSNGNYVILEHTIDGHICYSFYAHLSSYCVNIGDQLACGDKLGVIGKTGSAAGSQRHLHFSVQDTLWEGGGYAGYTTQFSGKGAVKYGDVTFYNPDYIIKYKKLPSVDNPSIALWEKPSNGRYDVDKAVAYAREFAKSRNTASVGGVWSNYGKTGSDALACGGDCANFVSQCLIAGGMEMDFSNWYWKSESSYSGSWTISPSLRTYLNDLNNGKKPESISDIHIGDVVWIRTKDDKGNTYEYGHVMIVTKISGNSIYVCGHSNDDKENNAYKYSSFTWVWHDNTQN